MATAAAPPASFTLAPKPSAGASLLQLPVRVAQALVSPGSGEGLLSLLPGFVRQVLPGWDPDRDMPDMFGKVVLVTGANSGIGYQTTRLLARNNAHVIMVVRDIDKGKKAIEDIKSEFSFAKLTLMQADMASLKSVRKLADDVLATGSPLHVLINNAGVLAPGPFTVTEEGFELTLATNFYGPLYLTLLLLPRLRASAPARIVNVASFGEMFGKVHWDDLRGVDMSSSGLTPYAASKLYLLMVSRDLNRRLRGIGVDVFPVHPGIVSTPGEAKSDRSYLVSLSALINSRLHGQSALRGALAPLFAATEPKMQGRGGTYLGPNAFGLQLFGWGGFNTVAREPVNWAAKDAETCKQLYDATRAVLDSATVAAGLGKVPVTHFQEAQAEALGKEAEVGGKPGLPLESASWR
ncbi:hypothetical protein PLESTB_000019600 [Pleodorina starrii]|uniref:Uncharacterized protein n=1 Tax=Pleodorina starrii TaxID=330485 RepID=A0A9W6EWN7_9CHLO|nr:hypothetical protein PLESTM_001115200 [Pleodorina starrii]GLC47729.1 hypothetical protein PLESTB_000019600 [Pleodorina starrii]GLC70859.1 hypothetical protein PLESTF_001040600 [Pleodorina starrii]